MTRFKNVNPKQSFPELEKEIKKYKKDKDNIYYDWNKIEWVDIESFEVLNYWYSKDKHNVYYFWRKIDWADPETFENLWKYYAKDKDRLYIIHGVKWLKIITWLNTDNAELLEGIYLKADNRVFAIFETVSEILWVDIDTFQVFEWWYYAKDKNYIYNHFGKIIDWVDLKTFGLFNKRRFSFARDKYNVYYWWEKLDWADPKTFEYLWDNYAKDKNYVYYEWEILEWKNPKTFKVSN